MKLYPNFVSVSVWFDIYDYNAKFLQSFIHHDRWQTGDAADTVANLINEFSVKFRSLFLTGSCSIKELTKKIEKCLKMFENFRGLWNIFL